jgi:hypothetical protein
MAHKYEHVSTGNGFLVADKDGTNRKQVITQNGAIGAPSQYVIAKPEVGAAVTVSAEDISGGGAIVCTLVRTTLDYPRNLLYTLSDAASDTLEAVFVTVGKDQFGNTVTETVTVDYDVSATQAGTQIFSTITSVTCTPTNEAASDTASVGVAIAADVASFGLPTDLNVVADVKSINWIDNGVSKVQNIDATSVSLTQNAFQPEQTVAAADDYVIYYIVST